MNSDESICIIHTPELKREIVESILCLFYCGKVSVTWDLLNQVNDSFKTLGNLLSLKKNTKNFKIGGEGIRQFVGFYPII